MTSAASISAPRARQAELARLLGVSRQAIGDLVKRKVFDLGSDGRIDIELARHALANRVRPSAKTATATLPPAATPPPGPDATAPSDATTSYHVAKTLREVAEARIAQLKLGEMKKELWRETDVRAAIDKEVGGLKNKLLQIPERMRHLVSDEARIALADEIRQVLAASAKE